MVTQSQSVTACVRWDPSQMRGTPDPHTPSEWGDRAPLAEGYPRPSHSSLWGNGPAHTLTWLREGEATQSHCFAGCETGSPSAEGGRSLPSLSGLTPPDPRGTLHLPKPR